MNSAWLKPKLYVWLHQLSSLIFSAKEFKWLGMADISIGPHQLTSSNVTFSPTPNHHGRLFYNWPWSPESGYTANYWQDPGTTYYQVGL